MKFGMRYPGYARLLNASLLPHVALVVFIHYLKYINTREVMPFFSSKCARLSKKAGSVGKTHSKS